MDKIEIREDLTVIVREYLSVNHIQAAAHFARFSAQLEADESRIFPSPGKFSEDWFFEHRAYVIASILSAVAFLEAAINELYADAFDNQAEQLDPQALRLLSDSWKDPDFRRNTRTLEKYQVALELIGSEKFEKGKTPYQPVKYLVDLRNALVHYVPDSRELASDSTPQLALQKKLERYLKGKFTVNPLFKTTGQAFFPGKCLGAGCAKWAVASSLEFTGEFFSRIGLTPTYTGIESRLNTS